MNLDPCPHCYRKVIPMADGTCPACGKNTNDRSGTDPTKVLVGTAWLPSDAMLSRHLGVLAPRPEVRYRRSSDCLRTRTATFVSGQQKLSRRSTRKPPQKPE